jgi:hypothetical protein
MDTQKKQDENSARTANQIAATGRRARCGDHTANQILSINNKLRYIQRFSEPICYYCASDVVSPFFYFLFVGLASAARRKQTPFLRDDAFMREGSTTAAVLFKNVSEQNPHLSCRRGPAIYGAVRANVSRGNCHSSLLSTARAASVSV